MDVRALRGEAEGLGADLGCKSWGRAWGCKGCERAKSEGWWRGVYEKTWAGWSE